jgi:hypothetical protein
MLFASSACLGHIDLEEIDDVYGTSTSDPCGSAVALNGTCEILDDLGRCIAIICNRCVRTSLFPMA